METAGCVNLTLAGGLRFKIDFGSEGKLVTDASHPLGASAGPDSEQLLVAAVANCLAGSLTVSLRKYKNNEVPMDVSAIASVSRNDQGKLRLVAVSVDIRLGAVAGDIRFLDRTLAQYEDFCVVTQSVRVAVPVNVRIFDLAGALLTPASADG
jgi:organic hydroperoxide reductase OsmC/OhrA